MGVLIKTIRDDQSLHVEADGPFTLAAVRHPGGARRTTLIFRGEAKFNLRLADDRSERLRVDQAEALPAAPLGGLVRRLRR